MRIFLRGLLALAVSAVFFSSSLYAEYLYKDEIIHNPKFTNDIEVLGNELHEKTGIALKLLMLKELPKGVHITEFEKEILKNFDEPTIVLVFSEFDNKVDIMANDKSLYKYFDKEQVLSPSASLAQAIALALIASHSFDDFKYLISNYGGTIIPILTQKTKSAPSTKYQAALFNGYADIADQIASSKGIKLNNSVGDANKEMFFYLKIVFYFFVLYALFMYIKRAIYKRRHK